MKRVASFAVAAAAVGLFTSAALADARLSRELTYGMGDQTATFDLEDGEKHTVYKGKDAIHYRVCNVGKSYTMTVVTDGTPNELDPNDCWDTQASEISASNQGSLPANARIEGTYHRVLGNAGMSN